LGARGPRKKCETPWQIFWKGRGKRREHRRGGKVGDQGGSDENVEIEKKLFGGAKEAALLSNPHGQWRKTNSGKARGQERE